MRPVATFNLHKDAPTIHARVNSPKLWLVRIWVKGVDKEGQATTNSNDIRPRQRCRLPELLEVAATHIEEMLEPLAELHDGGFEVFPLR